jgi:hypothetical protein
VTQKFGLKHITANPGGLRVAGNLVGSRVSVLNIEDGVVIGVLRENVGIQR